MRHTMMTPAAALAMVLIPLGCAGGEKESAQWCTSVKPGVITSANTLCVVVNADPVDPAVTPAEWKGMKIGFCCEGCRPRWEKLTEAEKDAAVAKVVKAGA